MEKVTPPALLVVYRGWAAACPAMQEWFGVYKHLVKDALARDPACTVPQFLDWALTVSRVRVLCVMLPVPVNTLDDALAQLRAIHEKAVARHYRYDSWPYADEFVATEDVFECEHQAQNCGRAVVDCVALAGMPLPFRSPEVFLASASQLPPLPRPTFEERAVLCRVGDIVCCTRFSPHDTWIPSADEVKHYYS
jgi:hypothetical protein